MFKLLICVVVVVISSIRSIFEIPFILMITLIGS